MVQPPLEPCPHSVTKLWRPVPMVPPSHGATNPWSPVPTVSPSSGALSPWCHQPLEPLKPWCHQALEPMSPWCHQPLQTPSHRSATTSQCFPVPRVPLCPSATLPVGCHQALEPCPHGATNPWRCHLTKVPPPPSDTLPLSATTPWCHHVPAVPPPLHCVAVFSTVLLCPQECHHPCPPPRGWRVPRVGDVSLCPQTIKAAVSAPTRPGSLGGVWRSQKALGDRVTADEDLGRVCHLGGVTRGDTGTMAEARWDGGSPRGQQGLGGVQRRPQDRGTPKGTWPPPGDI